MSGDLWNRLKLTPDSDREAGPDEEDPLAKAAEAGGSRGSITTTADSGAAMGMGLGEGPS